MDDLFDEFGNFLGQEGGSSDGGENREDYGEDGSGPGVIDSDEDVPPSPMQDHAPEVPGVGTEIVLHEDKQYYPNSKDVYGEGTETMVQEEDTQLLSQPLVASGKVKLHSSDAPVQPLTNEEVRSAQTRDFSSAYAKLPAVTFGRGELCDTLSNPERVRSIAFVGALHHGKTALMDMLIEQTHPDMFSLESSKTSRQLRFTDFRDDEGAREISIKCAPVSLLLPDLTGERFAFHFIDTPGHVNFSDEQTAAVRICDGVVVVIDAVEGMMATTEQNIRLAVREDRDVVVVLNKIDRLLLELKLPPADAYHKLRYIIDAVNKVISTEAEILNQVNSKEPRLRLVSPDLGNVCFASLQHGWSFTLQSFARLYGEKSGLKPGTFNERGFARRLWGDWYCEQDARTGKNIFTSRPPDDPETPRTFVEFILEPLYKLYAHIVGEDPEHSFPEFQEVARELLAADGVEDDDIPSLSGVLAELGLRFKKSELTLDSRPLLKLCCARLFGNSEGFATMCARGIASPVVGNVRLLETAYRGPLNSGIALQMAACEGGEVPNAPAVVHVTKLLPRADGATFDALGRVLCGMLHAHSDIRILGEAFVPEQADYAGDPEDVAQVRVGRLWLPAGRYRVPLASVSAGSLCLIEGVAEHITKTATLTNVFPHNLDEATRDLEPHAFASLRFDNAAVCKVAVEPLNPRELPKMLDGLRALQRSYPLLQTRVEESGEHVILGTGELQLDCALRDLREVHAEVEVRVSEPSIALRETVSETSALKCFGETPNGAHKLAMIAQPLTPGLAEEIEKGMLPSTPAERRSALQDRFDWDLLATRSIWCFGPDPERGPNILSDDTLPGTTEESRENKKRFESFARPSVVQGFQWTVREGPLCEEPMRACQYRVVDAVVSEKALNMGQLIPVARRVAYAAALTAQPRLMEPIYSVEILAPQDCIAAVYDVIQRRRGHVVADAPQVGTPLYTLNAFLPVLDSYGFETDLRAHTLGQAFCQSRFDHWELVPGDPLDRSIILAPLEPSPPHALARELMIKSRRRKGLTEDVVARKFFDEAMLESIEHIQGIRF